MARGKKNAKAETPSPEESVLTATPEVSNTEPQGDTPSSALPIFGRKNRKLPALRKSRSRLPQGSMWRWLSFGWPRTALSWR